MIMKNKKITSKKIGIILMVVFILGLVSFTIYSRGYVQRQKPLVQIMFPESSELVWSYETRSTVEPADEIYAVNGVEWTVEAYIPLSAFQEYMSDLPAVTGEVVSDNYGWPERLLLINRIHLDDGGIICVFEYNSTRSRQALSVVAGEGVTVHLKHAGAETYDYLVPFSAIHQDLFSGDEYVYIVNRRSGAWGWEYYVERQNVMFLKPRSIGIMANVFPLSGDLTSPIVYLSDSELYDGAIVRLWD